MLTLLKSLTNKYNPRIYVHADTDHGSLKKIKSLEIENENNFEVRFGIVSNLSVACISENHFHWTSNNSL